MDFSRAFLCFPFIIVSCMYDNGTYIDKNEYLWWLVALIIGFVFIVMFVLQAIALYTVASREGYKNKWLAFIPVVSTYYIGVCAQKNKIFNKVDARIIGIVTAVLELLLLVGSITYFIAFYKLAIGQYIKIDYIKTDSNATAREFYLLSVPNELYWARWCFEYLQKYILYVIDLVFMLAQVLLLSAFFQTYASRRYFLFTLVSIIVPVQGIIFFVIRKNKGLSYRDFVRAEQERRYRTYQQYQQQNFNQNPYNQNPYSNYSNPNNGPYNQNGGQPRQTPPEDPFAEFGGSGNGADNSDPFEN